MFVEVLRGLVLGERLSVSFEGGDWNGRGK